MHKAQSLINHVAFVLDASLSMQGKQSALTKVADAEIRNLKAQSEAHNQETRVSVYYFGHTTIECLIFDMDVARLPSTTDLYKVLRENTALIDATLKSQEDLATTSQLYGDHAFLTFVLTDGEENYSRKTRTDLSHYVQRMPENWSLGFLVPDQRGQRYVESLGVLRDSVAIWDTSGTAGLDTVGKAVRTATDNFFTARAKGVRGTRSVFSTDVTAVNAKTVKGNLDEVKNAQVFDLDQTWDTKTFATHTTGSYVAGTVFYQLTKLENIQDYKEVLIVDRVTGKVYGGPNARAIVGLSGTAKVKPDHNPKYDIFVQSTAVNRKLPKGSKAIIKK